MLRTVLRAPVAASTAAAAAATTVASLSRDRALCTQEALPAASSAPFSLAAPSRFDLETYAGRAWHFIDILGDLSTLFATREAVSRHQASIDAWAAGNSRLDDEALWHARKVVQATCHPATGELIPAPLRFSFFAPANLVICAGMLRPNPTLLHSAFWQWLNQSYNALVNHANRSGGEVDAGGEVEEDGSSSRGVFLGAYAAATISSVAIVTGLQHGAARLSGGSARAAALVRLTVPMTAVAVAANVNLLLVRRDELSRGIEVATSDGAVLGRSQLAARRALTECAITRVLWTALLLTATPLCASAAFAALPAALARSPAARSAVELGVSFGVIWLSVPLSIAVFPQRESMSLRELEEAVRRAAPEGYAGRVYFNKGL